MMKFQFSIIAQFAPRGPSELSNNSKKKHIFLPLREINHLSPTRHSKDSVASARSRKLPIISRLSAKIAVCAIWSSKLCLEPWAECATAAELQSRFMCFQNKAKSGRIVCNLLICQARPTKMLILGGFFERLPCRCGTVSRGVSMHCGSHNTCTDDDDLFGRPFCQLARKKD